MREFKFKFWNKKNSQFLQNTDNGVDQTIFDLWDWAGVMGTCTLFPMDDYVFLQYTGLTDKNKNLIYEGVIVKFSRLFEKERKIKELKSFVRFHNGQFGFDLIGFNDMFFTLSDECGIEVIGNIFEHPELLK